MKVPREAAGDQGLPSASGRLREWLPAERNVIEPTRVGDTDWCGHVDGAAPHLSVLRAILFRPRDVLAVWRRRRTALAANGIRRGREDVLVRSLRAGDVQLRGLPRD